MTRILLLFSVALTIISSKVYAGEFLGDDVHWETQLETNFLNYEWKDQEVEGETFFNAMAKSFLSHQDDIFSVEFGALGIHRFGKGTDIETKTSEAEPWLQIRVTPSDEFSFIMGSIDADHRAHDALISPHRRFLDISEEGFQLRYLTNLIFTDFWLNWKQRETKDKAESFEVGSINHVDAGYFEGDLQILAHHTDGQKTTDTTSLRNNVILGGGAFKLPIAITPKVGAHILKSTYKLNTQTVTEESQGHSQEFFVGANSEWGEANLLSLLAAKVTGDSFTSINGLEPYQLKKYNYVDASYTFKFLRKNDHIEKGHFGFRARIEQFKEKIHTTQEMSLAASF